MAIEYVKHVSDVTGNLTLTDLLAGDYVLFFAYREASSAALPVGTTDWVRFNAGSSGAIHYLACYEHTVAADGDVTSDMSWSTTASVVLAVAFRGVLGRTESSRTNGSGSVIVYPERALAASDGTSWVVTFLAHKSSLPDMTTPVRDLTLLYSSAKYALNAGPRSDWDELTIAYSGSTALIWISISIALEYDPAYGGENPPMRLRLPMLLWAV
ncbi:MAG: hypothetical protein ACK4KV_09635 [Rhodocyclaceae bacterium]